MHIGKWKLTIKDFISCLVLTLCFFIGLFVYNKSCAFAVLSGASTAVSIVLSVVAIIYTMIEGSNSSRLNQDTINRLSDINAKLQNISEKTMVLRELDKELKLVANKTIKIVEESSVNGIVIDDDIKDKIEKLKKYITEDIDE